VAVMAVAPIAMPVTVVVIANVRLVANGVIAAVVMPVMIVMATPIFPGLRWSRQGKTAQKRDCDDGFFDDTHFRFPPSEVYEMDGLKALTRRLFDLREPALVVVDFGSKTQESFLSFTSQF
jgi:hypothetical protein